MHTSRDGVSTHALTNIHAFMLPVRTKMKKLYRDVPSWPQYLRFALLATMIAGSSNPALAQFTTAKLTGRVVDPSGAGVPNAAIIALNMNTGFTRGTTSESAGDYLFGGLPIGTYQITVSASGFEAYTQRGISLSTGQAVNVPVQLKLGSVAQKVTVTANAAMVTTNSATLSQLIDNKAIDNLPLASRYAQQPVFLLPGAANVTANYCAADCEGAVFPSEQYAKINGAVYLLDGSDYNNTDINTNFPFPNPDAIEDFNVMTDNMSAIYGDAIGGVVNITFKSGTNAIHGNLFEYFQNDRFNARNWFAQTVSPEDQKRFGGTIGGPILKNKLFYFGSYQGRRFNQTNNGLINFVPNAAERTGDFSDLLPGSPTCQPYGTCVQLVDPVTNAPYSKNKIPVSPISTYLLKGIPLPNGAQMGVAAPQGYPNDNLSYNGLPTVQNTNEHLAKIDYGMTRNHLTGHYFQQTYTQPLVVPPSSNILEATSHAENLTVRNVSVDDVFTISPRFALGSYYGYTKISETTNSSAPFTMDQAGANIGVPPSGGSGANAGLYFSTDTFGVGSGVHGIWNRGNQSLREIATWTKGNNLIQFGGQAVRVSQQISNAYQQGGARSPAITWQISSPEICPTSLRAAGTLSMLPA